MIKSRIIWVLCLISALILFFFADELYALIFLITVVLMPVLMILLNLITAHQVAVTLTTPALGEKKQSLSCTLTAQNKGYIPVSPVRCQLEFSNLLTGEVMVQEILFPLGAQVKRDIAVVFESDYCGIAKAQLRMLKVYDTFGITAVDITGGEQCEIAVLPAMFATHLTVSSHLAKDVEADEYSPERAGADPSETFAIREYQPGDNLRRIHWKLSSKFDELLVKEPGLPVRHSFMLLLETSFKGAKGPPAIVCDALIEITLSLAQAMVNEEIVYDIGWQDYDSGNFFRATIKSAEELTGVVNRLLHIRYQEDDHDAFSYFADEYSEHHFEHLIYVAPFLSDQLELVAEESQTTGIICNNEMTEVGIINEAGNFNLYFCSPQNYEKELLALEI